MKLVKCLKEKSNIEMTFILLTNKRSTKILQGIVILPNVKEFILPDSMIYQQYMAADHCIKKSMILLHGSIEYQ